MPHRKVLQATLLASIVAIAGCQGPDELFSGPAPDAAPRVAHDAILEPLRDRPRLDRAIYFGDTGWASDYHSGLYTSDDRGQNWRRVVLPKDSRIDFMQFEDGGRIGFVVTDDGMMMRTADSGATWTTTNLVAQVRDSVNVEYGGYFNQFVFDAALQNGYWIDYCQILQTDDGGQTWRRLADDLQDKGSEERCVADAVYEPESGSWFADVEIYGRFLTSGNYLFRSDNDGKSWKETCSLDEVGLLLESVQSCSDLAGSDPAFDAAMGYFESYSWTSESETVSAFLEQTDEGIFVNHSLAVPNDRGGWFEQTGFYEDPTNGRIWLSNDEQLAYTDDGGERWHVVLNEMPDNEYLDFTLGADRAFAIYEGQYLAISEDLGKSWQLLNDTPRYVHEIKVLPDHNRVIVAMETGLAVVDTETLEWRDVPDTSQAYSLVVAGSVIWAFAGDGYIQHSTDAGDTWSTLPVLPGHEDFFVESAACTADACLIEGYDSIARLTAAPLKFEVTDLTRHLPDLDEVYITEMILDAKNNRAWIALEDGNLFGSNDGGRSWDRKARLGDEISEFRTAPGHAHLIAWGYSNRYLWSRDGVTFEKRKLPAGSDTAIYTLCWTTESTALIFAYDERDEEDHYFASLDGGATWGPTDPIALDDNCRVPGDMIVLGSMVARVK